MRLLFLFPSSAIMLEAHPTGVVEPFPVMNESQFSESVSSVGLLSAGLAICAYVRLLENSFGAGRESSLTGDCPFLIGGKCFAS